MLTELHSTQVWYFAIFVGIAAISVFDLWCLLTRAMGVVVVEWGLLGRWFFGLFRGTVSLCDSCRHMVKMKNGARPAGFALRLFCNGRHCSYSTPLTRRENLVGWMMHYGLSIFIALLLPLIWGRGYVLTPTLVPALLLGCLTYLSGLFLVQPLMKKLTYMNGGSHKGMVYSMLLIANAIFAMALYAFACLAAGLGF